MYNRYMRKNLFVVSRKIKIAGWFPNYVLVVLFPPDELNT